MNKKQTTAAVITVSAIAVFAAGVGTGYAVKPDSNPKTENQAATVAIPTTEANPTTTTPAKAATNSRGFIEKQFGANSGLGCKDAPAQPCDIEFIIGAPITPSNCDSQYTPENGKLIALPVTVTTKLGADMSPFSGMWNTNSFSALKPTGTTLPRVTSAAAYGCDESDSSIPDTLAPASTYEGYLVLDIPADATALMFTPHSMDGAGWEWKL